MLAWGLSVAGWLLAPGIAGAVAGYVVSNSINSPAFAAPVSDLFGWEVAVLKRGG